MKYVFYDLETTGKNKDWSQIIQFGAVCVDEQFNELDRFETRCRLKTGLVPEPEALIVNNTSIKNLENSLDIWKYEKLDETNRIANLIKQKL